MQEFTFAVDNVNKGDASKLKRTLIANVATAYNITNIEHIGQPLQELVAAKFSHNGFLTAVHVAYERDLPLSISPAHISICLLQILANVIAANPEKYRKSIVNFADKKTLVIERNTFGPPGTKNDWNNVLPEFEYMLKQDTSPNVAALFQDFTTNSAIDKIATIVCLMNNFQHYFTYEVDTMCGFPQIRLCGSVEDWQKIMTIGETILDLIGGPYPSWSRDFVSMLNEFVNTASKRPNINWWRNFYKSEYGSGGYDITGNIRILFPFYDGRYVYNRKTYSVSGFQSTITKTPFVWNYLGNRFEMEFVAGMFGAEIKDGFVSPATNFVVARKK